MDLKKNIESVLERIERSSLKAGRNSKEIKLIAVTKSVDPDLINQAMDFGLNDFGENKVQELLEKYHKVNHTVNFHMIGHLQTNKVKYLVGKVKSIHSIDSIKLAKEINKRYSEKNQTIDGLIQVHTAKEETKFGLLPEELENFLEQAHEFKNINFIGLMTIATFTDDEKEIRRCFSLLRKLKESYSHFKSENIDLRELSMGMTSDFDIAIEEGSTILRIGTAIFGEREYKK